MSRFDLIGFDADDTLWHTEQVYSDALARFAALLQPYHSRDWIVDRLHATEIANLAYYGYGIKSYILSMIETAIELTEGRITGAELRQVIEMAKAMVQADVRLIEGAPETVALLARRYRLLVITKGDLLDQEAKLARSGLAEHFSEVEIVSDKTLPVYATLLARRGVAPERFLMVGNSLRSDVLPVVELGGHAVYIPYAVTWAHEHVDLPPDAPRLFHELEHIGQLPELLGRLESQ